MMERAPARDLSHVPAHALAEALARVHAELSSETLVELCFTPRIGIDAIRLALEGGGFALHAEPRSAERTVKILAQRLRTLPDRVRPGLRMLICGSNPSLYSADSGIPFGRPGNRFWAAAQRAGLVEVDRDCDAALRRGIGFTDLVKRATRSAAEVRSEEYRAGVLRVNALIERDAPAVVCFVGLDGYRHAVERNAKPGWLPTDFGSRPAYLMPSTSGLNARTGVEALAVHLACAARGPEQKTDVSAC